MEALESTNKKKKKKAKVDYVQIFREFYDFCRAPPTTIDVSPDMATWPTIPLGRRVELKVSYEGSHLITACLGNWPLFRATKQDTLPSSNIYFQRLSKHNQERINETVTKLCEAAQNQAIHVIAWTGAPGIAKSASLNEILMIFLQNLGNPGFPRLVALRVNEMLVQWEWDHDSHDVVISIGCGKAGSDSSPWNEATREIRKKGGVLLVDPQEKQEVFACACPTVIALANREQECNSLAFNSKTGRTVSWLVVGPWTLAECQAAAFVEFKMNRRDLGVTLSEVVHRVQERWERVGGIPRFVLGEQTAYENRLEAQAVVQATDLDWKNCSIFKVHPTANLFMSAQPSSGIRITQFEWKFLSPLRTSAFIKLLRPVAAAGTKDDISAALRSLEQYGLEWQVAEQFVCDSLLDQNEQKTWEWYPDLGSASLDPATMMTAPPPGIKPLVGVSYFHDQHDFHFQRDVTSLNPTRLYRSMVLGEFFSFDITEKVLFMYQVSSKRPKDHAFHSEQCAEWRNALKMPSDWTFAIVYFLDNAHDSCPKGIAFEEGPISTIAKLNVKGYLVRAPFAPWGSPLAFAKPGELKLETRDQDLGRFREGRNLPHFPPLRW